MNKTHTGLEQHENEKSLHANCWYHLLALISASQDPTPWAQVQILIQIGYKNGDKMLQ